MPLFIDIRENKVLGREFKRGYEEGFRQGLREAKQEAELRGELSILRLQIEQRFGPVPKWAQDRLASRTAAELDDLSVRVLEARSIEELLQ